jgi:hypothetical protein
MKGGDHMPWQDHPTGARIFIDPDGYVREVIPASDVQAQRERRAAEQLRMFVGGAYAGPTLGDLLEAEAQAGVKHGLTETQRNAKAERDAMEAIAHAEQKRVMENEAAVMTKTHGGPAIGPDPEMVALIREALGS